MTQTIPITVHLAELTGLGGGAILAVVGMLIVFVGLSVIGFIIGMLNRFLPVEEMERSSRPTVSDVVEDKITDMPVAVSEPPAADVEEVDETDELPPEIVVVISAAVAAALGSRAQVKTIRTLGEPHGRAWVAGGRMGVMSSHKPHLRKPRS